MKPFTPRAPLAILLVIPLAYAGEFKFSTQTFTVPDGFEVELIAGPPLVNRPVSASFDDQGRLYVTDSSGSNEKPDKQLANPPHRVVRFEDSDGDGRLDKSIEYADKVMFPQGCLWYEGSVYVAGPPSIWKFTDTDGDGVADKREEWFKGGTLTGCANDIHGPYLGPDGYFYWTKGAFAEQTHTLGNGRKLNDRAAHIYRARPDGSDLDVIMSGGMDNPVEVAFTPEGEAIFTSTFIDFSQPGFRDGIAHAVYGGVFGKPHDVLEDGRVKRTGPDLLHPFYEAGPAAECGLCRYESAVFGADYRDNFFATTFNLHKVTRHILRPSGATYASTDSDFLVSDSQDFHPTDVLEDADGSLLVVDTGGWYKLCCPSSQLAKPDLLGAIYRVRRKAAPKIADPWGVKLEWTQARVDDLVQRIVDPRTAVRRRAVEELARRRDAAVSALSNFARKTDNLAGAQAAVFALGRIGTSNSARALWASLQGEGSGAADRFGVALRQTKLKVLSLLRAAPADATANLALEFALACETAQIRRVAAEAAGRIGDGKRTSALVRAAVEWGADPYVLHSATYALIEINSPTALREDLARYSENPSAGSTTAGSAVTNQPFKSRVGLATLIALDQMDSGDLKPAEVIPVLSASDERLRAAANWVVGHHPEWGGALAGFFRERLAKSELGQSDRAELQQQLARLARDAALQELLAGTASEATHPKEVRELALRAMAQASLKEMPAAWTNALRQSLTDTDEGIISAAIAAVRVLPAAKTNAADFTEQLSQVGRDSARSAELRLEALAALRAGLPSLDQELYDFLRANLDSAKPPVARTAAAGVVGRAKLSEDQLIKLTDTLKTAGPLEISSLLGAFDNASSEPIGLKLVAALNESKGFSGLRADQLKPRLEKFPATVQERGKELLARLNVDAEKQKAHLEELLGSLPQGDIRRGQAIFNSPKTACITCHAMGYLGGHVGPDLTNIGQARTERDLLESIVYPSASFVRSYEPIIVVTKTGDDHSGVLRRDAPDEVLLATGPNTEIRIARSDIAEIRPGSVSVMPGGLDEQLSRQELADLVTFLKATKWGAQ